MNEWPKAADETAQEYNTGGSQENGPTVENLIMDWSYPGLTQWTKDCATIFAADFLSQHKACSFPLIYRVSVDEAMVTTSFKDYVLYLKKKYLNRGDGATGV